MFPSHDHEGGFDANQVLSILTEGASNVPQEIGEGILDLSQLIPEGNKMTEELLRSQLTAEQLEAMFPSIEQRFAYAVREEVQGYAHTLSESNKKLLIYMDDYSKSQEDRQAAVGLVSKLGLPNQPKESNAYIDAETYDRYEQYNRLGMSPGQIEVEERMHAMLNNLPKENDFIQRPGQAPISFNENDIIIGGTNLLSTSGGAAGS